MVRTRTRLLISAGFFVLFAAVVLPAVFSSQSQFGKRILYALLVLLPLALWCVQGLAVMQNHPRGRVWMTIFQVLSALQLLLRLLDEHAWQTSVRDITGENYVSGTAQRLMFSIALAGLLLVLSFGAALLKDRTFSWKRK